MSIENNFYILFYHIYVSYSFADKAQYLTLILTSISLYRVY